MRGGHASRRPEPRRFLDLGFAPTWDGADVLEATARLVRTCRLIVLSVRSNESREGAALGERRRRLCGSSLFGMGRALGRARACPPCAARCGQPRASRVVAVAGPLSIDSQPPRFVTINGRSALILTPKEIFGSCKILAQHARQRGNPPVSCSRRIWGSPHHPRHPLPAQSSVRKLRQEEDRGRPDPAPES